jgi:hypothetical protein
VFCTKFLVAFQIEIALHVSDRKQVADLWADREYAGFEIAERGAGAAISR